MSENNNSKKKGFFLFRWLKRAFFPNKEMEDIYKEEQLESPFRMVIKNFFSKPLAVISLVIVIIIMLFVFIAPNYVTLDLGEQDPTLINLAPGYFMTDYPEELVKNGVQDISVGNNYAIGCDKNGKLYTWGATKVSKVVNIADIPEEIQKAKIVKVSAGTDHCVALAEDGSIYCWGNDRLGQCRLPSELTMNNKTHTINIIKIGASDQFSVAISDDGEAFLWGNENFVELWISGEYRGKIQDVALTNSGFVVLLKDGSVVKPTKSAQSAVSNIPEKAQSGVKAISASTNTVCAIKEDGSVVVWGAVSKGENQIPEFDSPVVKVEGGRYHYVALLENGKIVSWGSDRYKQCELPSSIKPGEVQDIYVGAFQNYALTKDGKIETWGLKGFLMGTDSLGRDIFARLVNGGKMTMTIGALSVVIETIIGVILGGIAGYFGGWVDMLIMRVSEIISSMPFIPFAMILSAVMGTKVSIEQRMYIIMVILGILSWPGLAGLVRAQMLAQREMEYVTAAKTVGVKESRIIFKHIIPNVMSVCLVSITLAFGTAMLTESTLSYLGFGVPLPTPTWGNMLTGANNSIIIQSYWWNWVFVGAIFGITCICINLIGDGLRDALDPKSSGR